jgi:hypothetical protein
MSFISNLVEEYVEGEGDARYQQNQNQNQSYSQSGGYGINNSNSSYSNNDEPPRVSYPWEVEWDDNRNTWVYINRETGQRTHEYPSQTYGGGTGGAVGAFANAGVGGVAGYEGEKIGRLIQWRSP